MKPFQSCINSLLKSQNSILPLIMLILMELLMKINSKNSLRNYRLLLKEGKREKKKREFIHLTINIMEINMTTTQINLIILKI